ncbi:MAG: EAL domain-containing protein [Pirellulaceae bacterium]
MNAGTVVHSDASSPSDVPSIQSLLEHLPHGLCQFDNSDRLVVCNDRFQKLYELSDEAVVPGTHLESVLGEIRRGDLRELLSSSIQQQAGFDAHGPSWTTEDGRMISVSCETLPDGGCVCLHEDLSRLQVDQPDLLRLVREDALTGLLNRTAFNTHLRNKLQALVPNEEVALLCIDLDHFKPVNDTLGHPAGDSVLQSVADRLRRSIRQTDVAVRLGGDEFAILQCGASSQPTGSQSLARRVIDLLSQPLMIDRQAVHVGASVGIAIAPYDGLTADELMKNADLALYRAKEDGRGVFRYFETEMDEKMRARRSSEMELRNSVSNEDFEVHYQPVLDIGSDRIVCFEALVRWNHPRLGRVSPDQFILLAEETGLIVPLGKWVLQRACRDAACWDSSIRVAVNLSPTQLRDRTLIPAVREILATTGLAAERLEFEITESSLLSSTSCTVKQLHQLRELGVRIALDDFGTGYSSINYLRQFPFDKIKIDRSFVSGADRQMNSVALVRMIAALGASLGVKTTAEGVETDAELESIRDAGCTEMQGYYLSKPIPAIAIDELLKSQASR